MDSFRFSFVNGALTLGLLVGESQAFLPQTILDAYLVAPHTPHPDTRGMSNYIAGGALLCAAAFSVAFLDGPTAVYVAVFCAITAVVLLIRGAQGTGTSRSAPDLGLTQVGDPDNLDNPNELDNLGSYDWDAHYKKEFGQ